MDIPVFLARATDVNELLLQVHMSFSDLCTYITNKNHELLLEL